MAQGSIPANHVIAKHPLVGGSQFFQSFLGAEIEVIGFKFHPNTAPVFKGIGQELGVNYRLGLLKRVRANKSQTSKGYYERHKNVHKLFEVIKPAEFNNKKVLLIDDVITTGSTLSSCASELNQQSNTEVLISTFAIAIR